MSPKKQSLVFLILITVCGIVLIGNKCASAQSADSIKKSSTEIIYDNSKLGSVKDRKMVTDVFVDYMLLKNSLANGNAADARFTTLTMLDVIADYRRSMDPDRLPDSKKFSEDLATLKAKVKQSTTLDEVRANFSALNNSFIDYIKSYGLYNKTIYLFHCDDNTPYGNGYWLSNSMTDTMNPYVGQDSSTDCNDVRESWIFINKFPESW